MPIISNRLWLASATGLALVLGSAAWGRGDTKASATALAAGIKAYHAGDLRTANVHLLNAVKADEANPMARALFGRVQLALGYGENGRRALDRARELGMPASQINHLLGEAALMQGDVKGALDILDPAGIDPKYAAYANRVRARALQASGNFAAAGQLLDQTIRLTPRDSMLWAEIGRYRLSSGNQAGAVQAAANAVKFGPKNTEAAILMGEIVRTQYGLIAALSWFERALEIDPLNLPAMSNLAATYGDAGKNQAMLSTARRMLEADENNPMAYYYLAVLAARANRPDLARSLIYRIGDRLNGLSGIALLRGVLEIQSGAYEQAISQLQPLLEMQPTNDKVRRLLGTAKFRSKDYRGAVDILLPIAHRADADSYTLSITGRALEILGVRSDAMAFLDRANGAKKGDADPFELPPIDGLNDLNDARVAVPEIGRLIANGRALDALARARYLQSRNPGVPATYVLVGDCLDALGRPGEAAEAYRQAANIRFNESTALRLVRALVRAGKTGEAFRAIDLFITQNPRSVAARFLAADIFLDNKAWAKAVAVLEGLRAQLGNRDAMVLNKLAWAHLNAGDGKTAILFARSAYELSPSHAGIANMYGWTLFETGTDKPKAIALLEKALAIDPRNYGFRLQLARAYAETGRKADARRELAWLNARPDFTDKAALQKLFKQL